MQSSQLAGRAGDARKCDSSSCSAACPVALALATDAGFEPLQSSQGATMRCAQGKVLDSRGSMHIQLEKSTSAAPYNLGCDTLAPSRAQHAEPNTPNPIRACHLGRHIEDLRERRGEHIGISGAPGDRIRPCHTLAHSARRAMLAAATLRAPRAAPARLLGRLARGSSRLQHAAPSTRGGCAARPVATLSPSKPAQPATEALPEQVSRWFGVRCSASVERPPAISRWPLAVAGSYRLSHYHVCLPSLHRCRLQRRRRGQLCRRRPSA